MFDFIECYLKENARYFVFLENLDPSLFQNIILGVLAIFIPFAIVFLTDILNSKNETRSEFEKIVLSDEVLGTKKLFWLSVIGIVFFSFFSGSEISIFSKLISLFIAIILIFNFWKPFKKILRFSEGYKPEFELLFLKKLKLSAILRFQNQMKIEKGFRAWSSFWSEKSEFNEREFTAIFISHIDDLLKFKKFNRVVELSKTYLDNIEKRESFGIVYQMLPKVFEWNEILWREEQYWLKMNDIENKIENFFSQKYCPTFRIWASKLSNRRYSEKHYFWNWNYFEKDFFEKISSYLMKKELDQYHFFKEFTTYIEDCERKLKEIKNVDIRERYWLHIQNIFSSFCPIFFSGIGEFLLKRDIWEHFPREWKIKSSNSSNNISHIILKEFIEWSREYIFKNEYSNDEKRDISEVINGIFPDVDNDIFTAFLMIFFSYDDIKRALENTPNFSIKTKFVVYSGSLGDNEEDAHQRLSEMMNAKEISQKEETIKIIRNYFGRYWYKLNFILDDTNRDKWEKADESKRKVMRRNVVEVNLNNMKLELESNEIIDFCKDIKLREMYRKDFLELIELLIVENKK